MVDKGETFELLNEADRLIRWYRQNRPCWKGPLTLPRTWRGKAVAKLLPRFATERDGAYFYDGIQVKIQGES